MKKILLSALLALCGLSAPGLLWAAGSQASASPLGYAVEDLTGTASVQRADGTTEAAKEGIELAPGDGIRVEADSSVVLMLNDDTSVQLGAGAQLQVSSLEAQPRDGFLSRLKLLGGRILAQVQKLGESRSTFEVEAGGVVCGVRGTAFEMDLQGDDLETRTPEGEVAVSSGGKTESVRAGYAFAFHRGLLRTRRRLDRSEMGRFAEWKKVRSHIREKRLKRLRDLRKKRRRRLWGLRDQR